MQLIVLGSGTAIPSAERGASGYLVESGETLLLLDCGSGTVQRLARARYRVEELEAVFISHAHLDHIGDLPSLLFAMRMSGYTRPTLELHGGPGLSRYVDGFRNLFGDAIVPSVDTELRVEERREGTFQVGELLCRVLPVQHHETSVGIRIEDPSGARLAYLGDTAPCDAAIELCRKVDLAVIECSYPDGRETRSHLTPASVAEIVNAAQPGHVLLTHLYPEAGRVDLVAALREHGVTVPVDLAIDGLGIRIG